METKGKILAVDDDGSFLTDLKSALSAEFDVKTATSVSLAMKALSQKLPDLILLDMDMPEISGLEFLKVLRQKNVPVPIIMLTGASDPESIVTVMRAGATDYIVKGSRDYLPSLSVRISNALTISGMQKQNEILSSKIKESSARYELLGISNDTLKLRSDITKFKNTRAFVLILGENGTGKELIARTLNLQENDPTRPFVAVNCGAISANLFESELFGHIKGAFTGAMSDQTGKFVAANGGDIFLDEIGELPPEMQVKLLRVLQERVVTPVGSNKVIQLNIRVIAATNKKLEDLVNQGKFREDLYFRLNQVVLKTSPLRERPDDIPFLAQVFARKSLPGVSISKEAQKVLVQHSWPGNIRELQNTIERACIFMRGTPKSQILPEHLMLSELQARLNDIKIPSNILPQTPTELTSEKYQQCMSWIEKVFLEKGLDLLDGDNATLIEKIGMSKSHYYRRKKVLIGPDDEAEVM